MKKLLMKKEEHEQWIVEYLRGKDFVSPSTIGMEHAKTFGFGENHHSAWASPICKRMVEKGILIRNQKGHYKLK